MRPVILYCLGTSSFLEWFNRGVVGHCTHLQHAVPSLHPPAICGALTAPTCNMRCPHCTHLQHAECNAQCKTKEVTYKIWLQVAAVGERMSALRLQLDGSNAQVQQVRQHNAALQQVLLPLLCHTPSSVSHALSRCAA